MTVTEYFSHCDMVCPQIKATHKYYFKQNNKPFLCFPIFKMIITTAENLTALKKHGLDFYGINRPISANFSFEAPCSLKFAQIEQGGSLGAFSYIVSGYICSTDIGRYCSFGEGVQIGRQNHPIQWLSTSPFLYINNKNILNIDAAFDKNLIETPLHTKPPIQLKTTQIKNDVWIGHGAMINAGICIENGAIIAAGSVVTKDVPAYAIVGGNPAKLIRYRFPDEIITQLLEIQWWQYSPEQLKDLPLHDVPQLLKNISSLTHDKEGKAKPKYETNFIKISELIQTTG